MTPNRPTLFGSIAEMTPTNPPQRRFSPPRGSSRGGLVGVLRVLSEPTLETVKHLTLYRRGLEMSLKTPTNPPPQRGRAFAPGGAGP